MAPSANGTWWRANASALMAPVGGGASAARLSGVHEFIETVVQLISVLVFIAIRSKKYHAKISLLWWWCKLHSVTTSS